MVMPIAIVSLVLYSKSQNMTILLFGALVILLSLGLPQLIDFLKSAALKGMDQEKLESANWKKSMDRIENLEALMCRLDAELNSQMEQALSSGKITTSESIGQSQMPTVFLNISSALEKRFQILKELGRGGMGIVFQAYDKQLKEQVAIKVLSPLLGTNTDALERLKREVSAARRITHPNVIRIHDISDSEGLHFVSMEFFSGSTLKELLKQNGAYSMAQGAQIAFQICDGLESAHRQGVIHRDLKSQNIIINNAGQLKIIDFGLASCAHQEGMTATGLILGTPEYMAPEQVSGKRADERADIYSFGIILYEIFTGKLPFTGDSAIAIGFQQLREEPLRPSEVKPGISADLEAVILKALRKDPADRYTSVGEMRAELQKVFGHAIPTPSSTISEQPEQASDAITLDQN
ncbi:serine/threonine protein kinase [bacterium]|nr:serine/threonine protein kinase [bacterium]